MKVRGPLRTGKSPAELPDSQMLQETAYTVQKYYMTPAGSMVPTPGPIGRPISTQRTMKMSQAI